jgi:hypothetical protein
MDDSDLEGVEQALDEAARRCLRLISSGSLTRKQMQQLSKWMYGCMNQRYTIRKRVQKRGPGELGKVLTFLARACEVLIEIDAGTQGEKQD